MTHRPTLRDVARLAGNLHPSTVSRSLHNDPAISASTRERVQRAAAQLGYRPDPLLDAFNQHRKLVRPQKFEPVVAFLSDFSSRDELLASPLHSALWHGARAAAEHLHCRLEYFPAGEKSMRADRLSQILDTRGILSVIVGAFAGDAATFDLSWERFSCVRIASQQLTKPRRVLASDLRNGARLGFRRLRETGRKRIALLVNRPTSRRDADFLIAGYLLECFAEGASALVRETSGKATPPLTPRSAAAWARGLEADAVLCDDPALWPALRSAGLAFAALDATFLGPEYAGIVHDYTHVAAQAVEQVTSLTRANLRGPGESDTITLVPPRWRDGLSAPPRPA